VKEGLFAACLIFLIATLIPATLFAATRSGVMTALGIPAALVLRLVAASGEKLACEFSFSVLLALESVLSCSRMELTHLSSSPLIVSPDRQGSVPLPRFVQHCAVHRGHSPNVGFLFSLCRSPWLIFCFTSGELDSCANPSLSSFEGE